MKSLKFFEGWVGRLSASGVYQFREGRMFRPGNPRPIPNLPEVPVIYPDNPWGALLETSFRGIEFTTQQKYICREIYLTWQDWKDPFVLQLPFRKMNKKRYRDFCAQRPALNDLFHMFYNFGGFQHNIRALWMYIPNDPVARGHLAHLLYDAYGWDHEHIPVQNRSSSFIGIMHHMRLHEDFSRMPIAADALQDTGYEETSVLEHMRTFPCFSLGSGLFKMVGIS